MIVSFSVSKFRSFATDETLSMVASPRIADRHPAHAEQAPGSAAQVLRATVQQ